MVMKISIIDIIKGAIPNSQTAKVILGKFPLKLQATRLVKKTCWKRFNMNGSLRE